MALAQEEPAPDEILASTDPGSETQRRFVYQACHLAKLALGLLDDSRNFGAVFCEQFDDALVKLNSDQFDAIQVKTRLDDLGPLKATDKPVLGAVAKFADLEQRFEPHMRRYVLASNVGFWRQGKSINNLQHIIDSALSGDGATVVDKYVKRLTLADGCSATTAVAALRKMQLDGSLPKLRDMFTHLVQLLGEFPGYSDHSVTTVRDATRALVQAIREASEAVVDGASGSYLAHESDPKSHAIEAVLEAKRFTRQRVELVLDAAIAYVPTFKSAEGVVFPPPSGTTLLERKLAAGGISYVSVNALKDLKTTAEYEFTKRIARDAERAFDDYEHVHVLVQTLGAEAHDHVAQPDVAYGTAMLNKLRARTTEAATDDADARGLRAELLQGIAAILTEECKLWWSEPFPVEGVAP
jgi:hypothetical protein